MTTWRRFDTLAVTVVALTAVILRIAYLAELAGTPFFDNLFINAANYDRWARDGYPSGEPYFQAPLYIGFLRFCYVFAPEDGRFVAARIFQVVLGVGTALLAFWGARRIGGSLGGLVAGLAVAACGSLIYFDGEILPTSLATFLLTGSLVLFIEAGRRGPAGWRWIVAGLVFGVAVTCRPNFLLMAPVLVAALAARSWPGRSTRRPGARLRWLIPALGLAASIAFPVALVTTANQRAGQGFVLLTSNLGYNLILGNNPQADGLDPFPPPEVRRLVSDLKRRGATTVEQSRVTAATAAAYMRENPGRTLGLWLKKGLLFYNRHEIPNNRSIVHQVRSGVVLRWPPAGWIGLGLLFPGALAGLVVVLRQPGVRVPIVTMLVMLPVSLAPFLVCARFRAPVIPLLAILTGVAVARLRDGATDRERIVMGAALLVGILVAWPGWYGVRDSEFLPLYTNRAKLFQDESKRQREAGNVTAAAELWERARQTLLDAVVAHPDAALGHTRLGYLRRVEGDLDGAEKDYERAVAADPDHSMACYGLAVIARQRGDPAASERFLLQAIAADPFNPELHVEVGLLRYLRNDLAGGVESFRAALELTPSSQVETRRSTEARLLVGRASLAERAGDQPAAEADLRRATELQPQGYAYWRELGKWLQRRGRKTEAIQALERCLRLPVPDGERSQLQAELDELRRGS